MDNRKRPRMETTATTTPSLNVGVGATTATIGGQSIFLTNASAADTMGVLPANVFLTICDDNSDESDEYLTIDGNTLAQIKQEQDIGTQTLPLQYRIINQVQRQPLSPTESLTTASLSSLNSQTLPASVQLPSGCEIYLVKEYINSPTTTISASSGSNELFVQAPVSAATTSSTTTIKVDPDSPIATRTRTGTVAATSGGIAGVENVSSVQIMRGNIPCLVTAKNITANVTETAQTASTVDGNNGKRSFILEAYKKRDDKRRATHNEVERRRRDKINSWIFKLKEMLPTEIPNNNIIMTTTTTTATNTNNNNFSASVTSTSLSSEQQQRNNNINNSRTPPSDSKSQILIKACDYIKAMQDEIKSLRECLTENENLRLSNQRLQNELNKIRNERSISNNLVNGNSSNNNNNNNNNSNSNYNITLNSLNSSGLFGAGTATVIGNVNNGATTSYTKRELIITDYVD